MNKQQFLLRKKRLLKYEDLDKLSPDDVVLVCRVIIQSAFAMEQLIYGQTGKPTEKLNKLEKLNRHLRDLDEERKRPVYGIVMSVEEIKETFSKEDVRGLHFVGLSPAQQKINTESRKEDLSR